MKGYDNFFDDADAFFDKWGGRANKGADFIEAVTVLIEAGHKLIQSESFRALCREIKARVLQTLKALEGAYRHARKWFLRVLDSFVECMDEAIQYREGRKEEEAFYALASVVCLPLLWK